MDSISALQQLVIKFRDDRDWKQFHNLKDLAICLNVEAGELLELFLWKDAGDANREKLADELADVFYCVLLLAHDGGFDLTEILRRKLIKSGEKYPVEKFRGSPKKYDEV